jgi:adenosylmethionine-8-amino-7-oxononanoate aminotransferase
MLMGCVEAVMDKDTKEAFPYEAQIGKRIDVHAQERGLILRPFGSMCVFSPPLIINKEQIDTMVGIMRAAIEATVADLKSEGVWNG